MNKIMDIDEKTIQIAYFLARNKGEHKFSIDRIYRQWCAWWKDDFNINGIIQPEVYNERLILSTKGAILEEKQPEFMNDYNKVLVDAQKWMIETYDNNVCGRINSDRFKNRLLLERKKNFKRLKNAVNYVKINASDFYIINRTNEKNPCELGKYVLHSKAEDKSKYLCSGTYQEVLQYIQKNLK